MPIFHLTAWPFCLAVLNRLSIKIKVEPMSYISDDDIMDGNDNSDFDDGMIADEKSESNSNVRKKIDDLLEKKRLKELLDDSDDW